MITAEQRKNVEAWIAALRSGDYKQNRGSLRYGKETGEARFCALGVAADLLAEKGKGTWDIISWASEALFACPAGASAVSTQTLPYCAKQIYGVTNTVCGNIMQRNDHEGQSFSEIADYLENWLNRGAPANG